MMTSMSTTPSDPDFINTKALEGFMHAFDCAINGKYGLGNSDPDGGDPSTASLVKYQCERLRRQEKGHRVSFWHTFPPIKAIRRIRDNIRLRRYNAEWIKNNIGQA